MVNGRLGGKIIKFAFPLVLTGMLQMLYNAADMVVVGQFSGHRALAAVSATAAFVALFVNFFSGLAVGTNAVLSQYIGSDSREDAFETVHTSVAMSLIFGVLLMISGFWFVRPVLSAMGTPSDVLPLAEIYLKIYFLGSPANLLYNFGSAVIRTTGDTKRPLLFLSIAGGLNICLNLFFVIQCHMAADGVAVDAACAAGDLAPVRTWLREKIWRWGAGKDAPELILNACGAPFDATFYCDYLQKKFSELYGL